MTNQFKKGDKVTVREGATSIKGHKTDPKEVRTVRTVWNDGRVGLHPTGGGTPGNVFEPEDLVPYVETPAPLDPSGRHDLAADFFHAKTGTAASYFTVDLSLDERAPYYAAADAFLATQPAPEPEPEPEPGTVAHITVDFDTYRALRNADGNWDAENAWTYSDAEVDEVAPLVVIDPAELRDAIVEQFQVEDNVTKARAVLATLGIEVTQ